MSIISSSQKCWQIFFHKYKFSANEMVQTCTQEESVVLLGTPLGNALRTWGGTSLGTCTRGFQIVMYRGALGCFEKGWIDQTLRPPLSRVK
jgi:hypothetical protein